MAHKHRTGNTQMRHVEVATTAGVTTNQINDGDLVATNATSKLVPVNKTVWNTDLSTTQRAFVTAFMGMASGGSRVDKDLARPENYNDMTVPAISDGDADFDVVAGEYNIQDLIGPSKDPAGNLLRNVCEKVTDLRNAIGVVTYRAPAGSTVVRAKLLNTTILQAK